MHRFLAIVALATLMSAQPGVAKRVTVQPGKYAEMVLPIPSPQPGDLIDVLTAVKDVRVSILFPDGTEVTDGGPGPTGLAFESAQEVAQRESDSEFKKLLPQGPGQHHIFVIQDDSPAGDYQIRLDARQAKTPAQVAAAVIPSAKLNQQASVDNVVKRHLELAEKARQKNDTTEQLKQLQPAFDHAIQLRSVESIGEIAGMIELAYRNIDQRSKGLAVMKRAAEAINQIAGPDSIRAAEFQFEVAMMYDELGRYAEGQTMMTDVARKIRKAAGPDSALLKQVLEAQAMMAAMTGREKDSASATKEAEGIDERRRRKKDFGFPPDPRINQLLEQARAALATKDNAEMDRLVQQITAAAEKLDIQNPQRAHTSWEVAILYYTPPTVREDLVDKHLMKALELVRRRWVKDG